MKLPPFMPPIALKPKQPPERKERILAWSLISSITGRFLGPQSPLRVRIVSY
jgi:hypothetical protein